MEITKGNPTNDATQKAVKSHSTFQPNFSFFNTFRYQRLTPHFSMATVADDKISLRNNSDVDTFTLQSPVMSSLQMRKSYFHVPIRALLPRTADLLLTTPRNGEDVVASDVNVTPSLETIRTGLSLVLTKVVNWLSSRGVPASGIEMQDYVNGLLLYLRIRPFLSACLSNASLAKSLGISALNLGCVFNIQGYNNDELISFDTFDEYILGICKKLFDGAVVPFVPAHVVSYTEADRINTVYVTVKSDYNYNRKPLSNSRVIPFRKFLDFFENGYYIPDYSDVVLTDDVTFVAIPEFSYSFNVNSAPSEPVNLSKLLAYQLVCAEFFSNDKVDPIYSAKIFQEQAQMYLPTSTFTLNGLSYYYDGYCGYKINTAFDRVNRILNDYTQGATPFTSTNSAALYYLMNLLCYNRALRFKDYFVGSRPNPLAVGDVDVDVNDSKVNIIDVSYNIQIQRFLNQVNRVGRKFTEYFAGIFGTVPTYDPHDPLYLASTVDTIGAEETSNTGEEQYNPDRKQAITSNFRLNSSRFAFEFSTSEPGFIIGVTWFELPRAYATVTDRVNFAVDRDDMFNPFLQFVGDQPVYVNELDPAYGDSVNFSYQLRYAEYKARVSHAAGGFIENLPGYCAVATRADLLKAGGANAMPLLSSDFIRLSDDDINGFYLSLTGLSDAAYFHFIIRNDFDVTAKRPMVFAPSIL